MMGILVVKLIILFIWLELERIGVSMVIIEDKTGLKRNSLFGNDVIKLK